MRLSVLAIPVLALIMFGCAGGKEKKEEVSGSAETVEAYHGSGSGAGMKVDDSGIDYSGIETPEGGVSVAEVYKRSADLGGQPVLVRGRVVKVNRGIMGTNWIHLRDGTGEAGSNNLTVTSDAEVEVGDLVTVQGVLVLDRDFGAGYRYPVIIENAAVTSE